MRIGLNLLFLIPGEVGGTETYTRGLLKALARADNHNRYIVFINRETRQQDFIRQPNFSVVECGVNAGNRAARLLWEQFILPFQVRAQKLDVLHSLGYVAPLILPCKSIATIHDLNYRFVPESMTTLTRIVNRFFITWTAQRADHIIAVSEFVRRQLTSYLGLPPEKITAIHEAVERDTFGSRTNNAALYARYGIQHPYIFAFSSLTPHKNISGLLRAFAVIKRDMPGTVQLVVVGHQPRTGTPLSELTTHLNLNKRDVIFTGYVDDQVRGSLLANATVFAFPSFYEGFGLPALEAMAYGVAVACSNRASLPEVAGDAAAYFDPANTEEMAAVLTQLLNDPGERRSLIERGKKNLERFSWEQTARQTLALYESMA